MSKVQTSRCRSLVQAFHSIDHSLAENWLTYEALSARIEADALAANQSREPSYGRTTVLLPLGARLREGLPAESGSLPCCAAHPVRNCKKLVYGGGPRSQAEGREGRDRKCRP